MKNRNKSLLCTFLVTLIFTLAICTSALENPDGYVSADYVLNTSAKLHAMFYGNSTGFTNAKDYLLSNGIISEDNFSFSDKAIDRESAIALIARSVPDKELSEINSITSVNGLNKACEFYGDIIKLYNAGIITGTDEYGSFNAKGNLKRYELEAIISRIVNPEERKVFTPKKVSKLTAPLFFIDDARSVNNDTLGKLGWDFDTRGGILGASQGLGVHDVSFADRYAIIRDFDGISEGKLTFEALFNIKSLGDGFSVILSNDREESSCALILTVKDSKWYVSENGVLSATGVSVKECNLGIKTITDLDKRTNEIIFDGKYIAKYGFAEDCQKVGCLIIRSDEEHTAEMTVSYANLYTGYALNAKFVGNTENNPLPYGWEFSGNSDDVYTSNQYSSSFDQLGLNVKAKQGSSVLKTSFEAIGNKVCFEAKFFLPEYPKKLSFNLTQGNTSALSIISSGGKYYTGNSLELGSYNCTVWQTVRIEANTLTGVVVYKINNRVAGSEKCSIGCYDGVSITFDTDSDAILYLDDIFVYNMFDEESDYVPTPIPCESENYDVGVEVCDIWRNGYQFGWDLTSSYDFLTTKLGFFDEGSTEVADWENKWLCEHGIDFKLVCWYGGTSNGATPIKLPRNSAGINAYMNSKYSQNVKYALMYENSGNIPQTTEDFRKNILAYWLEYYLSDKDRYYTIDNKALITIYRYSYFLTLCGNDYAKAKAELDNIRNECKKLGYDGAIILTTSGSEVNIPYNMGFDGVYAYNWGSLAYQPEYQKTRLTTQRNSVSASNFDVVPTVGVGFNNTALNDKDDMYPTISNQDYNNILSWVKNDYLPSQKQSFAKKLIILSNWNEMGEGHFIMPSETGGFGYLDEVRKVFTNDSIHEDIAPTDAERSRFNSLYKQDKRRIRRQFTQYDELNTSEITEFFGWHFSNSTDRSNWNKIFSISNFTKTQTSINGYSSKADFGLFSNTIDIDAQKSTYIHVRMKLKPDSTMSLITTELYFITDTDSTFDDAKRITFTAKCDNEYHDYYVPTTTKPTWTSNITQLRIDPMVTPGYFEITDIEFMENLDEISLADFDFSSSKEAGWAEGHGLSEYSPSSDGIHGVGTGTDYSITYKGSIGNASDIDLIKITMRNTATKLSGDYMQLFYITDTDSQWSEEKSVKCTVIPDGEFHDYLIDISKYYRPWTGNITSLRFDPLSSPGEFTVKSIELVRTVLCKVYVNGIYYNSKLDFAPKRTNSGLMMTLDPNDGIFNDLGIYHTWDGINGILTLYLGKHYIRYTIGSDIAQTDTGEVSTKTLFTLRDGLPYVCFDVAAKALEMPISFNASTFSYNIYTNSQIKDSYVNKNFFGFDYPGFTQGWTNANSTLIGFGQGYISYRSGKSATRYDPIINSPALAVDASKYKKIEIRMRYSMTSQQKSSCTLYFCHSGETMSDKQSKVTALTSATSGGQFITLTFDMSSNSYWNGIITNLRFDPFENSDGTFDIDYIKIY